jgi:hypothetical protein
MDVHLKHGTAARFRELVENAWRGIAPKQLVAQHDEGKRK